MARWHPLAIVIGGGLAACFTKPGGPEASVVADARLVDAVLDAPLDGSGSETLCSVRDNFDIASASPCGTWGEPFVSGGVALARYNMTLVGGTSGAQGVATCRTHAAVSLDVMPQLRIATPPNVDGANVRFEIVNALGEIGGIEIRGHTGLPSSVHWNGPVVTWTPVPAQSDFSYVRLIPGASDTELRFGISSGGTSWDDPGATVFFESTIDTVLVQIVFEFANQGQGSAAVDDFSACP